MSRKTEAMAALYAELPAIDCAGKCSESCGPILMTGLEWRRICHQLKRVPVGGPDLTCPMLKDDRCTVYDIRPMICRLWGIAEEMPCPWGCKPERYLNAAEGTDFLRRAQVISGEGT